MLLVAETARAQAGPTSAGASRLFQVLADPTRVRLIELLVEGEKKVGELVNAVGLQQGRVSSHLACLRWCGFVATRRQGKFVYYRIADARVREIMRLAHQMLGEHAGALASCACCAPPREES